MKGRKKNRRIFALVRSKEEIDSPISITEAMASNPYLFFFFFFLWAGFTSSYTFISHDAFECHRPMGRNLLQAKSSCPVNFENQNYTILTSRCKGPNYPANICCDAFKEFACPFADQINDMNNDCATTMFSYINIYGKYPPGLFANMCRGDKKGLVCNDTDSATSHAIMRHHTLLPLTSAIFPFLFFHLL